MSRNRYSFLQYLPSEVERSQDSASASACESLPGYADLELSRIGPLSAFLVEELECKDLDQISDYLWLMTTQGSDNISWLHRQKVKGREIVPTEEPKLHLVWFYDKIYIKPVPRYLLSQRFWEDHLLDRKQALGPKHRAILRSALGLLRTYAHLIRYESDIRIAQNKNLALLPDNISWDQWCMLRKELLAIEDRDVSGRFRFGEIRLTRLNFYCKFLLYKPYYHRTHRQYGDYFASFYPPLLFLFGIVSVTLGSMQLAATVEQLDDQWRSLLGLFRMFSAGIIGITFLVLVILVSLFAIKITNEWVFALGTRYALKERRNTRRIDP